MDEDTISPRRSGRIWAGLFLVCVGAVIALDQMGFPLPYWLFNWQNIPIVLGLFIGFRHGFRGGAWILLILVGLAFEFQDYYPRWELHRFILPGVLILVGIMFVLNPRRHRYDRWHDGRWHNKEWKHQWKEQWRNDRMQWKNEWRARKWKYQSGPGTSNPGPGGTPGSTAYGTSSPGDPGTSGTSGTAGTTADPYPGGTFTGSGYSDYTSEDYLDTTTFFGGIHKKIVSKTFKGGDVVTIMGGTELDFSQADIFGRVKLEVVQIMGATKIIVPAHWEVRSDITAIFAGFEDKRQQPTANNPGKILIIDGVSLFGGIELKNF